MQDLCSFSAIEKFRGRLEGVRKPGDIVLTHFSQGTYICMYVCIYVYMYVQ